ncbi:hypothetical protein B9479_005318 [Cryptococcus floricola]|uniref:BZIP domain-containing protein n=1 Tax=Cryptococcus floricola TaxID=2591691 RepID=A0A5D3ATQ2_9TREE|nr:hypothetical protein B9479_005318 [Cryptococcus floricola]
MVRTVSSRRALRESAAGAPESNQPTPHKSATKPAPKPTPTKRTPAKRVAAVKREPSLEVESDEVSDDEHFAAASEEPEELVSIHIAKKRTRGGRVIKGNASKDGESDESDEPDRKPPARKRANTERRSVQNKTAQKKYRDKKKSLARRTHDFALDMTRLCGKLGGKEGKVFKRLLEDYLADVSSIDRNFFDEYLEKAGLTQES